MKSSILTPILSLLVAGLPGAAAAQCVYTSTTTGGLFSAPSTWTSSGSGCGTVPTGAEQVRIKGPVTLNQNLTFSGNTGKLRILSGGSLIEDATPRTLTMGVNTGSLVIDRAGVDMGGQLVVSELHIKKSIFANNGPITTTQTTVKCNAYVENQGVLTINGRVVVQGNLHLDAGNSTMNGNGGLQVAGCVVGTNGALIGATQGNLLVCVQKLANLCGTGTCNTDIPIGNVVNCLTIGPPTLPVELMAFKARGHAGSVDVTWQTASERNSDRFVVERSAAEGEFAALATLPAAGTSSSVLAYQWHDTRPLRGIGYYRLRQVDRDGTFSFSSVVSATTKTLSSEEAVVWPSEAKGVFHLRIAPEAAPGAQLAVLTPLGQVVRTLLLDSSGETLLDLRGQSAGLYLLRITTASEQLTRRILLTAE